MRYPVALLLTPKRLGEHRKATCAGGGVTLVTSAFKVAKPHLFPVVRREFPAPVPGLMEACPAVVRRPFPEPCVGQMELFPHA